MYDKKVEGLIIQQGHDGTNTEKRIVNIFFFKFGDVTILQNIIIRKL